MKEFAKTVLLLAALVLPAAIQPAAAVPITQSQIGQAFYLNRVDGLLINDGSSSQFQGSAQPTSGFHLSGAGSNGRSWSATTSNDYNVPRISATSTTTGGASASSSSQLYYSFAVSGADGNVPVSITASGGASASQGARAFANLTIQSMDTFAYVVNQTLDLNNSSQIFSINQSFTLAANVIYRVTMQTLTAGSNGTTASAFVDPYFSAPAGYTILTSLGIGNLAPSAVPIPAALPLFASALGALGLFGWRRKKAAAAATA
jgi:hypothetical protein